MFKLKKRIEKDSWIIKKIITHRGLYDNVNAPENSMRAFSLACENDFGIELDVNMLKSGEIVVFHDANIKRMTGVDKLITDCTFDEILKIKLGDTNQTIPLLEDVIKLVNGKVPLLVEIKNRETTTGELEIKTYDILKKYSGEYAIQSFNPLSVMWFKKNAPEIIRGQISGGYENWGIQGIRKFMLKYLAYNIISKPDFINYEIKYIDSIFMKFIKMKKKIIIGWVAGDKKQYEVAMEKFENVIIEKFIP